MPISLDRYTDKDTRKVQYLKHLENLKYLNPDRLTQFETVSWLPDMYDPVVQGMVIADNALPHHTGFLSVGEYQANADALADKVVGSIWGRDADATPHAVVGTSTGLFQLNVDTTSWKDITPDGLTYSGVEAWSFSQFGDFVIAVTQDADPLIFNLNNKAADAKFVTLAGNPPQSEHIAVVRDFVVVGNTTDDPSLVQWSGFNNAEIWGSIRSAQADFDNRRSRDGKVQAIVSGEYGVVFQENAIYAMTYYQPTVFRFDTIDRNIGTDAPRSVCWEGGQVFFYARNGFHKIDLGGKLTPIGSGQVDRWFEINVADPRNIRGVISPNDKTVMWSCSIDTGECYDAILMYRYDIGKWGLIRIEHELLSPFVVPGTRLEDLDPHYNNDIDGANQVSFDSPRWKSGSIDLHVFKNHTRGNLDGPAMKAHFETGYFQLYDDNADFRLQSIQPHLDRRVRGGEGDIFITAHTKEDLTTQGDLLVQSASLGRFGRSDFRLSGRWLKISMDTEGDFDGFSGFFVRKVKSGTRFGGR